MRVARFGPEVPLLRVQRLCPETSPEFAPDPFEASRATNEPAVYTYLICEPEKTAADGRSRPGLKFEAVAKDICLRGQTARARRLDTMPSIVNQR